MSKSGRSLAPAVLAVLLAVFSLLSLTAFQATGRTAATRLLGRLGASLVEIDRWLPVHRDDLLLLARDKPQGSVPLNDFPIDVSLPAARLLASDEAQTRGLVVEAMGHELYQRGNGAFQTEAGKAARPSLTEPARWIVSLLARPRHRFWTAVLPLAVLLLVAAEAGVLATGGSPLPPLVIGAGAAALACLVLWLLFETAFSLLSSPLDREIALILRDCAWIGLRDSGAVLLVAGGLFALLRAVGGDRATGDARDVAAY